MSKKEYVHGWRGQNQCLYGKDQGGAWQFIEKVTLASAKRIRNNVQSNKKNKYAIYKLVEVKP